MNWYYRMLLSYTPIFFVVISSIIFVFFTVLNNASENRYMDTNRTIVEQMMRNTDANLKLIERNVVSGLVNNNAIQDYFSDRPKTVYDYFVIQKNLIDLKSLFPFVHSIYLYKESDRRVLADSGAYQLASFADKPFLMSAYGSQGLSGWTNPRAYSLSMPDHNPQKVVSLVKLFPNASLKQGAVVVSIYTGSIVEFLNSFVEKSSGSVRLLDSERQPFQTGSAAVDPPQLYAHSPYTGWYYYTDSVHAKQFTVLSFLSNVWVIVVLIMIVLALGGFTFITHMHYKPLEAIFGKVGGYTARKGEEIGRKTPRNEFAFIETALDHLLKKSLDYDNLYKEDTALRQQQLFQELLAGHRTSSQAEWERQMAALSLPHAFDRLGVVALEIDHYRAFTKKYKQSDQHLLKFILESAFRELAQQRDLFVWHAWMKPYQIVFAVHLFESETPYGDTMRLICEDFRTWINRHLELTVSAGIGEESSSVPMIVQSCRNAQENVAYKAVFGTNTVIDNRMRQTKADGDAYFYFQAVQDMTQSFRKDEKSWKEKLIRIFESMNATLVTKQAMAEFMSNVTRQLTKELGMLSPDIQLLWMEYYELLFEELVDDSETLAELQEQLTAAMEKLEGELMRQRINRKHHSVAVQVKNYIDEHYADPGLSLIQISDRFGLESSTLSHLFKEELGEKFIDYVLKLRFGHAKRLLVESDEPILSIAEKVGYNHVISFHRAFKKLYNLPPGEYRSLHRSDR
ncbi:helix-turn-helix domain-containing protein [Paenibacillus sepulcri]